MEFHLNSLLRPILTAVFLSSFALPSCRAQDQDILRRNFQNPPSSSHMECYWWWLNGNTTKETISRDLEQMRQKGYRGAILVDANGADQRGNRSVPAGPMFGTPEWTSLYTHALATAARLHMEISLNIMSGWNLGGPFVTPEEASKVLTWSHTTVDPDTEEDPRLSLPPQKNSFYRDIAVLAYPLNHGDAFAGQAGAEDRKPIRALQAKSASIETGFSMPDSKALLTDDPAKAGEEDAKLAEVQNITAKMDPNGILHWRPTSGTWEVLRIGYTDSGAAVSTSSGQWQGLAIDYMDHEAFDSYWKKSVAPLLTLSKPYLRTTLKYLVTDSWELGGTNWTTRFRQEFRKRRGYDPIPFLPVIAGRIIQDRDTSNRFLADMRRTVADLIVAEHYDIFAKHAAEYGLGIHPESGGPHGAPIDALETFRNAAYPQTEYWAKSQEHRTRDEERFFIKEAASAAHIYGKQFVSAEGMTSIGPQWSESLGDDLRPSFDQALTEGMNLLYWHTFTSSPSSMGRPGQEYFAGTHLNPNVTWWPQATVLTSYINRAQYLLQQGKPVADVLYYYGDHVPGFVRLKADDPAHVLPGYDYDVVDQDLLLKLHVESGAIATPKGLHYRALVLPSTGTISLGALKAIESLVAAGATVIGTKPARSTGLIDGAIHDEEIRSIVDKLWGDCTAETYHPYGEGRLYCSEYPRQVLEQIGTKEDLSYESSDEQSSLDFIHRIAGNTDIYFVRNTTSHALHAEVTVRVTNKQPELWDQATGLTQTQLTYVLTADGRTKIPLWLEPYGSTFLIFRKAAGEHIKSIRQNGRMIFPHDSMWNNDDQAVQASLHADTVELTSVQPGDYQLQLSSGTIFNTKIAPLKLKPITGTWTLNFPQGWGAPEKTQVDLLKSWTEFSNPGIRYFSGTGIYRTTIDLPVNFGKENRTPWLDLGEVHETAAIRVNGKPVRILWKRPYRVSLQGLLKPGKNTLEIAVTNLWPNRLIGDAQPEASKRYTHTNITAYQKDSPLLPSGLIGPVQLEWIETATGHREIYKISN